MEETKAKNITHMLNELYHKYKDNQYIIQRLETHLSNLPNTLEHENKKYYERISRINELTIEQDNFYKVFLSKHQYYYMPYNSIYYVYDGKTYTIIKDDDIHYQLLTTITDEQKLIQWKHKTKQNIIKKIKERTLYKSTPETYTIQNILGFLQTIFQTKTEAKYFVTIIGDCILKKNNDNLLYFVSSNLKKIITFIDSIVYATTGNSIMSNFISKYHESHKLTSYRLIKTNDLLSLDITKNILNNIGIDLFCVATHYSDRYNNAENYLNAKADSYITNRILYFAQNTLQSIIDEFINQCIDITMDSETDINWKNMHYIWKLYLSTLNIPNMIYSQQLLDILITKISHKKDSNNVIFTNVTSKYLPNVSSFLSFWEKYIIVVNDQNITEQNIDDEYEIDELMSLYKNYDKKLSQINDASIIKMICHYFSPQVEVIDNKYVTNIKCILWSKNEDVTDFLQDFKHNKKSNIEMDIISFDDLYQSYKNYINAKILIEQKYNLIVSKQYFEKYLTNYMSDFIKFDKFISSEWLHI